MSHYLKEPLLHFMLLGAALFVLFDLSSDGSGFNDDELFIRVDETALTTFMQFRAKAFDSDYFRKRLADMPATERDKLIADYIREEVLYREAKSMEMDVDDYIIRRRMVQKIEFITRGITTQSVLPTAEAVQQYFSEHKDDYYVDASVTFTHIFFDGDKHGGEQANKLAEATLQMDSKQPIAFEQAVQHGDRFPFHLNYVDKNQSFISSHFGEQLAEQVFDDKAAISQWIGPISSVYGEHLLFISQRSSGHYPELAQVQGRVEEDYRRHRIDELQNQAIDAVVANYRVEIAYNTQHEG